jgi:DNA-directed RNA polymerase specialized sigma24 family protein
MYQTWPTSKPVDAGSLRDGGEKPDFLETVARQYAGELQSFVQRRVGAQDAEDLLQNAYVRLLQHPDPASIDDPRAFLYRVSANLATDRDRAQAVRARHHTTTETLERVAACQHRAWTRCADSPARAAEAHRHGHDTTP